MHDHRLALQVDANIRGECAYVTHSYRHSLFYSAFPRALNLSKAGWTVEQWNECLGEEGGTLGLVQGEKYHRIIVVEIGANNVWRMTPEDLFYEILMLVDLLHQKFPHCKILLLSVLPRLTLAREETKIEGANALLSEHFLGAGKLSYLHFADVSSFFFADGALLKEAFLFDKLHLSRTGYLILENAIKSCLNAVDELVAM